MNSPSRFGTGACRHWRKQAGEASENEKECLHDCFVLRVGSPMFLISKVFQRKHRSGAEGGNGDSVNEV